MKKIDVAVTTTTKKRHITFHLPDCMSDLNFDKLALDIYPHKSLKDRLMQVFVDLYVSYQKCAKINESLKVFSGSKGEIQMEVWEEGKHIILAKGEKWLCPCNIGQECIFK